jgi:hypothetical protein
MRDVALLASLEARRTAPVAHVLLVVLLAAAAARFENGGQLEPLLADLAEVERGPSAVAGAARAGAATLAYGLVAAIVVMHAAGLAGRWRQGDGDWLGARPITPLRALAASFLGLAGGAVVLTAAAALAIAAAAPRSAAGARPLLWRAGPEGNFLVQPGERYREVLPVAPGGGALLRLRLTNTAEGIAPVADVVVRALAGTADGSTNGAAGGAAGGAEGAAGRVSEARARVGRRTYVELALPEADPGQVGRDGLAPQTLSVELACLGPAAVAVLGPQPIEAYGPPAPFGRVDLALAARALAAVLAAAAVAAAFGAWVAAPVAALGALALAVVVGGLGPAAAPEVIERLGPWVPGLGLGGALEVASRGQLPAGAPVGQALGVAIVASAALALARVGTTSWRHLR